MQSTLLIAYQQTHGLLRIINDFSMFCTSWSGGGLCFGGDRPLYLLLQTKRGTWSFPDERQVWVRGWKRDHPGGRGEREAELKSYEPRCGAWLESGFHRKLKLKTNPDQMEMAGSRRGKPLLWVRKQFVWLKISVFHRVLLTFFNQWCYSHSLFWGFFLVACGFYCILPETRE